MEAESVWVFGRQRPALLLPEEIDELLSIGVRRAASAALVPTDRLLEVFARVSRIWSNPEHELRRRAQAILPDLVAFSPQMVEQGLDVIAAICRPESIRRRWDGELGGAAVLDGWLQRPQLGYDLRAVPHGLLVHVAAGNVFVGAVDSLLSGMITKNANLLKLSHADPVFPPLFLESLRQADSEGWVWPNQALVQWKGGDEALEKRLYGSPVTVVFWGGAEAQASVRRRQGPETRLIENGPRYSFAVADRESLAGPTVEQAVAGLAVDLSRWDQQACSSPHVVYVIDQDDGATERLMERLSVVLDTLAAELPRGRLTFDEQVEIRRIRELAAFSALKNDGVVKAPARFDYTLIRESSPDFKISCLNRTLFFKRIASIDVLMEHITPMKRYLQTVGLFVSEGIRQELEPRLLAAGAKRLTAWGGMSEGRDGAPHEGEFMLRRLVDWVDREYAPVNSVRVSSTKKPDVRLYDADIETARAEALLEALRRTEFYRPLLLRTSGTARERLLQLPLLDRETFYRVSPPASNDILSGPLTNAYVYASGGTTGEPKFTFYANDEYRAATDVLALIYQAAGISTQDVVGNLFLAGNLWTSFNVSNRALENIGCLNLPIGGASDYGNIIKYLKTFSATAVVGLPSIIVKLAEEVRARHERLSLKTILYGGEHLRAPTVAFLREQLGCELVRSAGYACVDTGPIGYQCLHLEGTLHHVLTGYQLLEIIDTATGEPCGFGQPGEIVSTNLERRLMPVVRYRTGDLGRWVEMKTCACGFEGRTFELLGRCDDQLVIGGINLLPADVAPGLSRLPVSPNFQIIGRLCDGREQLTIRLEAETELPESQVRQALVEGSYKLEEALREGWLALRIEWYKPGKLPRNARTGKLKVVIDER